MTQESTIESLTIEELCEMYAMARDQVARGKEDIATAQYASRNADMEHRRKSGQTRKADGERAMSVALEEIQRRVQAAHSDGSAA